MSAPPEARVLVALDPAAPEDTVLDAVASLSAGRHAEVLGLYVEDIKLLRMARLSVVREITAGAGAARAFSPELLERQFRVQASRMRTMFENAARRAKMHHDFQVTRGEVPGELLKVAQGFDVLVLGHSRSVFGSSLTGRDCLAVLLTSGPRTLVFVQERWPTGRRVVVLYDGGPASTAALRLAAQVVRAERLDVSLLLPRLPGAGEAGLRQSAQEILGDLRLTRCSTIERVDLGELTRVAKAENPRVMFLPYTELAQHPVPVAELLERVSCSLITVR